MFTVILFATVIAAVIYLFFKEKPKNLPPGPPTAALPFFGHLLSLGKHPQETLSKWCSETQSDIIHCYFGQKLVIVLNNYSLIKEAFLDDNYSARAQPFIFEEHFHGKGLTYADGERWSIHRKFAMATLKKFGMGKVFLQETILGEIQDIFAIIDKQKQKAINIKGLLTHGLSNIICGFAFGERFSHDYAEFQDVVNLIEECFTLGSHDSWITIFPLLRFVPIQSMRGNYKQFSKNFKKIFNFAKKLVENHKQNLDGGEESRDYIDEFLRQASIDKKANKMDSTFDMDQLVNSITNLFIGGTETTSTTLRWAFIFMIENPDILKKCQSEIDEYIESANISTEMIQMTDKPFLPYLQATILEIQRCANIATLGGSTMHRNLQATTLAGYNIPKDTYIAANFYSVHVDGRSFPDPDKFDPKRFLSDDFKSVQRHPAYIPFSIGKKSCPGEALANMELFLFISNFIRRYNFYVPNQKSQINSKSFYTTSLTRAPYDYQISFINRNDNNNNNNKIPVAA
uniref:Cytochrome P450 n=1 Tax=Panagrolaimus davidi TaxID=227884 RepID=A0A914QZV5_9BILA